MRGFGARLVGLDVGPEAVLVGDVANLPEHSVLVLVAVAALHLVGRVALLLFPLLVALVVDHFVAVLVGVELVVLVVLVVLFDGGLVWLSRWLITLELRPVDGGEAQLAIDNLPPLGCS